MQPQTPLVLPPFHQVQLSRKSCGATTTLLYTEKRPILSQLKDTSSSHSSQLPFILPMPRPNGLEACMYLQYTPSYVSYALVFFILFNWLQTQSSSDLPLLVNVRNLAARLLASLLPPSSPFTTPSAASAVPSTTPLQTSNSQFSIGFITPPFKDNKIPVTDHLHAHAYIGPADLMGWWRGIAYGPLAWYAIDDLVAEIRWAEPIRTRIPPTFHLTTPCFRESVSNNRIKSGYQNRQHAPIDMVPQAGARAGTADGIETSEPGLAPQDADLEGGEGTLGSPRTPSTLAPQSHIPHLRV